MAEKRVALKQKISDLEGRIAQLIWDLFRFSGVYSTRGSWIIGIGMAVVGIGFASIWGLGNLLAWCFSTLVVGTGCAVIGCWGGYKGGKWWEDHLRAKKITVIQSEKEALLDTKVGLLQEKNLEVGTNFIVNPRFPGEEEVIYGKPSNVFFLMKMREIETIARKKGKIKLKTLNISDIDLLDHDFKKEFLSITLKAFDMETFILSNNHLGNDGIQYLKKIFLSDREAVFCLKELDVSGNDLTSESLEAIKEIVTGLELEALDLSHNECLGSLYENVLKDGKQKRKLVFGSTNALGKFFRDIPVEMLSLKILKARNIGFPGRLCRTDNLGEWLYQALRCAPFLEQVDLSNNSDLRCGVLSLIRQGVRESLAIRALCFDETHEALAEEIKEEIAEHKKLFKVLGTEKPVLVAFLERLRNQKKLTLAMEKFLSLFVELDANQSNLIALPECLQNERELTLEIEKFLPFIEMLGAHQLSLGALRERLKDERELTLEVERFLPSLEIWGAEQPTLVALLDYLKNQPELPAESKKFLLVFKELSIKRSEVVALLECLWEQAKLPLEIKIFLSRPIMIAEELKVLPAMHFNYKKIKNMLRGILEKRTEERREAPVSEREVMDYIKKTTETLGGQSEVVHNQSEIFVLQEMQNNPPVGSRSPFLKIERRRSDSPQESNARNSPFDEAKNQCSPSVLQDEESDLPETKLRGGLR